MLSAVIALIFIALLFTYINGFHDTANAIATVVATKVLSPKQAVLLAAVTNLIGALMGTAVAETIANGIVNSQVVTVDSHFLLCALLGAITWNLITWRLGLPSSSSHALIGGMVGTAIARTHGHFNAVLWFTGGTHWWQSTGGVVPKIMVPMVLSILIGVVIAFVVMSLLYALLWQFSKHKGFLRRYGRVSFVNNFSSKAQLVSASAMGVAHGMNDAQKSMGVIAMALIAATASGQFDQLPGWLHFLQIHRSANGHVPIPPWLATICALTMAGGTASGGWRIIKTLGHKMVRLHPINGFAAESVSASLLLIGSTLGIPLSTTQLVSSAIMGVGAAKRFNAIQWTVVKQMVCAWMITLPCAALLAYGFVHLL